MKKEKTVRTYQRRTKSGKMVTVREHKSSYDAAEEARKAAAKKAGAGTEFVKKKTAPPETELPFTPEEFKEWYHWDMEDDPKNKSAIKVEKALKDKMGTRAYKKYLQEMTDSYTARGHNKAQKALMSKYFSEKGTSTESKGHPKVISHIDKLVSSYQRDIEKAQKHIDAGEKWVGVKGDRIPTGTHAISWREQKKRYEKAITQLEKGREYHLSGKENQAWNALRDFVGFNKNHVISKETRTKNEIAIEKKRQKAEEHRIKVAEAHAKAVAASVEKSRKEREAMKTAKRIPADLLKKSTTKSRNGRHPVRSIYYGDKTLVNIGGTYYRVTKAEMAAIRKAMPEKVAKR